MAAREREREREKERKRERNRKRERDGVTERVTPTHRGRDIQRKGAGEI